MNNFQTRAVAGAVFVAILVSGILYNFWSIRILFFIISMLGLYEFYTLVGIKDKKVTSTALGGILYLTSTHLLDISIPNITIICAIGILFLILELFSKQGSFSQAAHRLFGILYVVYPFSLTSQLDAETGVNAWLVLGMFILIWTNDTGAYLTGRQFGKTKLFERISPKKTIEGLAGGGVLTLIVGIVLSKTIPGSMIQWLSIALVVFVFANLGDLVESMLKRNHGIKDSGNIIPGHGGILDRFDGVLLTLPMIYLLLQALPYL